MIKENLKNYVKSIKGFEERSSAEMIEIFALFLEDEVKKEAFSGNDILECFELLRIKPYSNISAYLLSHSKRGKSVKFIKKNALYHLEGLYKKKLLIATDTVPDIEPTNSLYPLSLFDKTRGYLVKVAKQASICYDQGQYDASFVMVRKLLEILIIECFERKGKQKEIQNANGDYQYLSDLVISFSNSSYWHITRNAKQALPKIKHLADQSAHNRKFIAQKNDLDKIKDELRTCLGEMLNTIDYPNWN